MKRFCTPRAVATALTAVFTALWWWVAIASAIVALVVLAAGVNVGVQIGPNGEPNFVAGSQAQMVLPVAFELDRGASHVRSATQGDSGAIERANGLLRFAAPDRPWLATAAAAAMLALTLWILAELAALCRSVRNGRPFVAGNVRRIRRLALALALGEVSRAAVVYGAHAYVAAHFTAEHVRFTSSPHVDATAIVSALIVLVLAEVFRTGTRLDEDQSLTV